MQFKRTVILYPLCILAIWLPCVFLGVAANAMRDVPRIEQKLEARRALAAAPPASLTDAERARLRRSAAGDDVILVMLDRYAPLWLAGLLGAGIMAAVMASDSQILALSTMFTEDVFAFYGGRVRFGEAVQVQTGRLFVVILTVMAYVIALRVPQTIFDLAVQFAFSGYASLSPLLFAALFWRAEHEVGRACRGAVDGRCGDLHRPGAGGARMGRPAAGRADDPDFVRADDRGIPGDRSPVGRHDRAVQAGS